MSEQLAEGICDGDNPYFIVYSSVVVVLIGALWYLSYRSTRPPIPGKIEWQAPLSPVILLWSIGLWNILPPVIYFIVFFFIIPSKHSPFTMASKVACNQINNYPILPAVFILNGLAILLTYKPDRVMSQVGHRFLCNDDDILGEGSNSQSQEGGQPQNEKETAESKAAYTAEFHPTTCHAKKILLAGRGGMYFLERLKQERERNNGNTASVITIDHNRQDSLASVPPTLTTMVIYAEDSKPFVENNALAMSLVDSTSQLRLVMAKQKGLHNKFIIPLEDNSFDKVILTPMFRKSPPTGDFMCSEEICQRHMKFCMRELFRVLKPGGKFVCVDLVPNLLLTKADVEDCLGEYVEVQHPEVLGTPASSVLLSKYIQLHEDLKIEFGAVAFYVAPAFLLQAWKPGDYDQDKIHRAMRRKEHGGKKKEAAPTEATTLVPKKEEGKNLDEDDDDDDEVGSPDITVASPSSLNVQVFESLPLIGQKQSQPSFSYKQPDGEGSSQRFTSTSMNASLTEMTGSFAAAQMLPRSTVFAILVSFQLFVFVLWCFIGIMLAEPLNVPTNLPIGQRIFNVFVGVSINFPLMAFFERELLLKFDPHFPSIASLLFHLMKSDVLAVLASFLMSLLFSIPSFFVHLALAQTGASKTLLSVIGMIISVLIGLFCYKWSRKRPINNAFTRRGIDLQYLRFV